MRTLVRRAWRDNSGTALAEAAIVFPVLITLSFGVFDFSNYFYQHQAVTTGVRDAARYLARNSCTPANLAGVTCPSTGAPITLQSEETDAAQIAVYGDIGGSTPRVPNWSTGQISFQFNSTNNASANYRGAPTIYTVTVSTSFTYGQMGFLTMLGLGSPTIYVAHTERCIGG